MVPINNTGSCGIIVNSLRKSCKSVKEFYNDMIPEGKSSGEKTETKLINYCG